MELRVLSYFLVVAQESNITTAAARLHVGQPTLSRQLKDLERELGQKLFVRQSHGVRLTEEGQLLQTYAKEMLEIADKVERDFAGMRTRPLGDVYIGGIDAHFGDLARVLYKAREEQPGLVAHYSSCSSPDALAMLDHGLIDFALVSSQVSVARYESQPFPGERVWVACMRPDHPLAQKSSVTLEDLAGQPLLMYDQALKAPLDMNNLAAWFGGDFSGIDIAATSNLSSALCSFAHEGLGVLITWGEVSGTVSYGLATRPLSPRVAARGALVWRSDRPLTSASSFLLDMVRKCIGLP